jgi:hypothetical protein
MAPPRVPALPRLRILCPSRRRNLTQMDPLQKLQEDSLKKKDENTIAWSKKLVGKTFVDDGAEHNLSEDQVSIAFTYRDYVCRVLGNLFAFV